MKRSLLIFAVGLVILLTGIISCKKEMNNKLNSAPNLHIMARMTAGDSALESRIQSFYASMQSIYLGTPSGDSLSADSTEFLIEAAYNYYISRKDDTSVTQSFSFSFTQTISGSGKLSMNDVEVAFYQIKDSLMSQYANVDYINKSFEMFDLVTSIANGHISFGVSFGITSGSAPSLELTSEDQKTFNASSNHAWSVYGNSSSPVFLDGGECDINATTETAYNVASTYGAPVELRYVGLMNWNENTSSIAYGQLITNIQSVSHLSSTYITSPLSDYSYIPGYFNPNMWITSTFYTGPGGFIYDDPDLVYKQWITTPMMNFYLSYIPSIIVSNLPSGKVVTDLQIAYNTCLCYPAINPDWPTHYSISSNHDYTLRYGTITGIPLPPPYALSDF